MMKLLWALVFLGVIYVVLRVAVAMLSSSAAVGLAQVAGVESLTDCPDTPNCQCSVASRAEQQVDPFSISNNHSEGDVINILAQIVEAQRGARVVLKTDQYLHATFTTRLMGYIDDVEFHVGDANVVHVRSASRLGYSDLGANAKRIEMLRAAARDVL